MVRYVHRLHDIRERDMQIVCEKNNRSTRELRRRPGSDARQAKIGSNSKQLGRRIRDRDQGASPSAFADPNSILSKRNRTSLKQLSNRASTGRSFHRIELLSRRRRRRRIRFSSRGKMWRAGPTSSISSSQRRTSTSVRRPSAPAPAAIEGPWLDVRSIRDEF